MKIRRESEKDFDAVFALVEAAFKNEANSDHREQFLVERLRKSDNFVPELSIVAEINNEIVGYILLTKIQIKNSDNTFIALALAPVAVLPAFQNKGIGGALIKYAHEKAKALGFIGVVLLGHAEYYPRFGYSMAKNFNIKLPFEVPDENCMVLELEENALKNVYGVVVYDKAFYE